MPLIGSRQATDNPIEGKSTLALALAAPQANDLCDRPARLRASQSVAVFDDGLALAKRGINEDSPLLLERARQAFEATVAAASEKDGLYWRATINLGHILRRLGRPGDAAEKLEEIRSLLFPSPDGLPDTAQAPGGTEHSLIPTRNWLADASRALDGLGSAYSELARQHGTQPELRKQYLGRAIDAYSDAIKLADAAPGKKRADRTQLLALIHSNLANVCIDAGDAEAAIEQADAALELLSGAQDIRDRELTWARTQRVKASALVLKAGISTTGADTFQNLKEAIATLEDARERIRVVAVADWNQITVELAIAEERLGAQLTASGSRGDTPNGIRHLCRAIRLWGEAFSYFARIGLKNDMLGGLRGTLKQLSSFVGDKEESWMVYTVCINLYEIHGIPQEYSDILSLAAQFLAAGLNHSLTPFGASFLLLKRQDPITALAEFIASLGLSETEAGPVFEEAFRRLGWSEHTVGGFTLSPKHAPEPSTASTALELFGRVTPGLQRRRYTREEFPPEWLDDPAALRAARKIANARSYNNKKGVMLTDAEIELARTADRFVKQAKARRRAKGQATPKPG
jgi:tetratricopeptide (TPR) repeat protein